jgi:hypothetical protein
MLRKIVLLVVCLGLLSWATAGFGQVVPASITGTVKDASGAVIPGATVTITNLEKNTVRTLATDANGNYLATLLAIGRYNVMAESQGFKKALQTNVELHVSDQLTINLTLAVGNVSQEVTVEANPVQVELQSAMASGLVSGTQVRELSLNNRNYEQLLVLMPGVTSGASDQLYIGTTNPSGQTNTVQFSINGNRTSANSWMVDGADNIDRGSSLTLLNYPSVDAIAEFKVERSPYSADLGRAGGGQINVVTKSGGSKFHGDAYEFFRNDKIAANTFFNNANKVARPPLRYNDFGYTFGGPIYIPGHYNQDKDKTFFFFSEEFRRVITYGSSQAIVPTTAEKNGIFTTPVCIASSGSTCTATASTITNINPVAAAYIKDIYSKLPDPQNVTTHSLYVPLRNVYNHRQELIKIDHIFGPKLSIAGRYLNDSIPTIEPGGLFTASPLPGVANTQTNSPGRGLVFRATSTFSPTILNEAGYSFSYGAIVSIPTGLDNSSLSPDIKVPLPFPATLGRVPTISMSGISGITGYGPYNDYNRNHNIYDNFTKILGKHTLRFGVSYNHYQKTENTAGNNVGSFTIQSTPVPSGTTSFNQVWANFLLGNVSTFTQASIDITPDIRAQQWEMFFQDDFKVRPNLTFNYGVRYSLFRQPIDNNGLLDNFDPATYSAGAAPKIDPVTGLIIAGSYNPLNGIITAANGGSPYGSKVSNENNKNIAPRIGIAWDPFGNGKTSIRSGYGIFYDSGLVGTYEQNIFANPPFVNTATISNTRLENPAGGTAVVSLSPKVLRGTPIPFMTPYVQQWSLDVQREIGKGFLVDLGYFGSKGTHLLGIADINTAPPGAAQAGGAIPAGTLFTSATEPKINAYRPYLGYNAINVVENWFDSNYHSMQLSMQKRLSGNSLINLAYTWSKNLTDNASDRSNAAQNFYNRHGGEYGLAQFDRRQVLTVNYVYELPWMKNQEGPVGHVLGGWQISGITTFGTGNPFTVTTSAGTDPAGLGILGSSTASPRPNQVSDPNANAPHTITQWFNTSAFVNVAAGSTQPGNAGRYTVAGPGYQRWDFSLFKNFKVSESVKIQFRTELFNAFNHTNPLTVSTSLGSTTFGQITATRDPRVIQFGLKLNF